MQLRFVRSFPFPTPAAGSEIRLQGKISTKVRRPKILCYDTIYPAAARHSQRSTSERERGRWICLPTTNPRMKAHEARLTPLRGGGDGGLWGLETN